MLRAEFHPWWPPTLRRVDFIHRAALIVRMSTTIAGRKHRFTATGGYTDSLALHGNGGKGVAAFVGLHRTRRRGLLQAFATGKRNPAEALHNESDLQ